MILLGLGGNLPSPDYAPPADVLAAALERLLKRGVRVLNCSPLYRSEPVPVSQQPWFVNAVALLDTSLAPQALLAMLHRVEAGMGRVRGERWAARIVDLDLLAYGNRCVGQAGQNGHDGLVIPHPRMAERAFVLAPLADLAPDWRHPVLGKSATELLAALGPDQKLGRIVD
jgi:2-amino-4-hydroxy-6-hydroxymethyldihydropteridine diphosphokinase